jgi:hypothetical protein
MPVFDMGRTRRVSTKYQGHIGAPPAPTAEMQASGRSAGAAAKRRADAEATQARYAREGQRPRRAGPMKSGATVVTSRAVGSGGGGGVATSNGNGETEKAWWENYWLWAGVAALWWMSRRKKR